MGGGYSSCGNARYRRSRWTNSSNGSPVTEDRLSPFRGWLAEVSGVEWLWYVKYLSANDTSAKSNVHQGGPYISKPLLAAAFHRLSERADQEERPDLRLLGSIDSHGVPLDLRLVWYNSKRLTGAANGRDEARLTGWGGRESPLLEPNAPGSLTVFAFKTNTGADADLLRVWRCTSIVEEDHLLELIGDIEPGDGLLYSPSGTSHPSPLEGSCSLAEEHIPEDWKRQFPSGETLISWVVGKRQLSGSSADLRLTKRRDCEYDVFRSVERYHVLPRAMRGFETVDGFVEFANSVVNRRKSRSGKSLELHLRQILGEESISHSWTPQTEGQKTPDFIFPSIERYHQRDWPTNRLRMLAAKTTCKDRWRQILNEADRIPVKHLLTLQEGVSEEQHREMAEAGVRLVVPEALKRSYPENLRSELLSVEQFLAEVRSI